MLARYLPNTLLGRWVPIAGVLIASGCDATSTVHPEGAVRYTAPEVYSAWWDATLDCAKRPSSAAPSRWWRVAGDRFPCNRGECAAYWSSTGDIYVAERWIEHELVIRHEMLHHLLRTGEHPDPPFAATCALTWESQRVSRDMVAVPYPM